VHDRLPYLNRFESVAVAIVTPKPHQLRCFRTLPWLLCFALVGPAAAFQQSAIEVEPLAESTASWNGTLLPAYPTGQPEVTVLRIRIAPGARLTVRKRRCRVSATSLRSLSANRYVAVRPDRLHPLAGQQRSGTTVAG